MDVDGSSDSEIEDGPANASTSNQTGIKIPTGEPDYSKAFMMRFDPTKVGIPTETLENSTDKDPQWVTYAHSYQFIDPGTDNRPERTIDRVKKIF